MDQRDHLAKELQNVRGNGGERPSTFEEIVSSSALGNQEQIMNMIQSLLMDDASHPALPTSSNVNSSLSNSGAFTPSTSTSFISATSTSNTAPSHPTSFPSLSTITSKLNHEFSISPSLASQASTSSALGQPFFNQFHPNINSNSSHIQSPLSEHVNLNSPSNHSSGSANNSSSSISTGNNVSIASSINLPQSLISPSSVEDRFSAMCDRLSSEMNSTIDLLVRGLEMRRAQLQQQLTQIMKIYSNYIYSPSGPLAASSPHMTRNSFFENGNNKYGTAPPLALPNITFTKPDSALLKAVTSLGFFNLPAFAPNCTTSGDGLDRIISGRGAIFTVITRNCFNEDINVGGNDVSVEVLAHSRSTGIKIRLSSIVVNDLNNGKYTCEYLVPQNLLGGDDVQVAIKINGAHMSGSPFIVYLGESRAITSWRRLISFGDEGPHLGQFCRPWGVAMCRMPKDIFNSSKSNDYIIAVADRSNNRIQLFRFDVTTRTQHLMQVFGTGPGARPGQLDRPAGITLNPNTGQVIVADKDNHRIQVFDMYGKFLFKFGEKGNRPGQFNYPWDIDCNLSTNELVVSDTRNRRIQVFNVHGNFMCQFNHHIDSPRGVSWLQPELIVITDFNKHRIVMFDRRPNQNSSSILPPPPGLLSNGNPQMDSLPNIQGVRYIGFGEGSGWGELLRPQGIATAEGRIFCSDSRNNRVAIWTLQTQAFEYVLDSNDSLDGRSRPLISIKSASEGSSNNGNGSSSSDSNSVLDRPAGIAACDNMFVIVDFGHNRLHVCQRSTNGFDAHI